LIGGATAELLDRPHPQLDEIEVSEMSVSYTRVLPAARLADWEAEATGLPRDSECVRREEGVFVSPALLFQRYTIDAEGSAAFELLRGQGFTPETLGSTHVFLQIVRNYATDRAVVAEHLRAMFHEWAVRDAPVLETVQRRLSEVRETAPRHQRQGRPGRGQGAARRGAETMAEEDAGRATTSHEAITGGLR
jgi:vanillate O-demethylase monooxygenase subunit